jgi:serine/threonine protein kinase
MWAIGCVFFTVLAGYAPFDEDGIYPTLFRIFKTCGTPQQNELMGPPKLYSELDRLCPNLITMIGSFPQWPPMVLSQIFGATVSECAIDLLTLLLQVEPSARISASDALAHPFFKQYVL